MNLEATTNSLGQIDAELIEMAMLECDERGLTNVNILSLKLAKTDDPVSSTQFIIHGIALEKESGKRRFFRAEPFLAPCCGCSPVREVAFDLLDGPPNEFKWVDEIE